MRTAGIVTGRNLVIASVQSNQSYPVFIHSNVSPGVRPNGGDLVEGDTWYSSELDKYHVYVNDIWTVIGGKGFIDDHTHDVDGGDSKGKTTPPVSPMITPDPVVTTTNGLALMVEDSTPSMQ